MTRATDLSQTIHITAEDIGAELMHCPFCGSNDVELQNTWTPSYWVACKDCDATAHGNAEAWKTHKQSRDKKRHRKAAQSAVEAWNLRAD